MPETYFVTGTDTGVGKTVAAAAMLIAARARGLRTIGLKPVASGCEYRGGSLWSEDAGALMAAMSEPLPYVTVNPYPFEPAIAPHLAAQEAGVDLRVEVIARHCRAALAAPHDFSVIEGAGGWRVPLSTTESFADLARTLHLPVVLVVGVRLGCINHALLSAEAIVADGLRLAGWIANRIDPGMSRAEESIECIGQRLGAPCIARFPFSVPMDPARVASGIALELLSG